MLQKYIINLLVIFPVRLSESLKRSFAKKTPNHADKFIVFTSVSPSLCKEMSANDTLMFLLPQIVTIVIN
ncbi:TPA: hypothetical protein ACIBE2_002748, partial [Salmonella enterica subsp. diarizonae serovar 61:r:-]